MGDMRIMATNYSEIYMVFGNDEKIGRKYAILSTLTQQPDNQQVIAKRKILTFRIDHSTLRNMPNRVTKRGLSCLETWSFEVRLGRYRNSKDA